MAVDIKLDPQAANDLAKLARRLKTLGDGKTVPKEFRAVLRKETQPVVRSAKSAARALPSKQKGKSHLRADIARATSAQIRTGPDARVGVRISKKALGARGNIPRLMNYQGGWVHPTFGHRPDVLQRGTAHWYDNVMRDASPGVRKALERRCAEFERKLMSHV